MKIGFSIEPAQEAPTLTLPVPEPSKPVRSLVQVRFEGDGRLLTYYNDLFDLAPGDRVFVSGKLAGIPGTVEKITTKFKINLSNYERVISMGQAAQSRGRGDCCRRRFRNQSGRHYRI